MGILSFFFPSFILLFDGMLARRQWKRKLFMSDSLYTVYTVVCDSGLCYCVGVSVYIYLTDNPGYKLTWVVHGFC